MTIGPACPNHPHREGAAAAHSGSACGVRLRFPAGPTPHTTRTSSTPHNLRLRLEPECYFTPTHPTCHTPALPKLQTPLSNSNVLIPISHRFLNRSGIFRFSYGYPRARLTRTRSWTHTPITDGVIYACIPLTRSSLPSTRCTKHLSYIVRPWSEACFTIMFIHYA